MILEGSHRLVAEDLTAVFLPPHGMLGASLRHRGIELLRRVEDLEAAAAKGSTAGIPLLHPWANRLERARFRVAGREVAPDMASPLLHADEHGLPIHGVPWSRLVWEVVDTSAERLVGRLEWRREPLLAVFPFPHTLEMNVSLASSALTIDTTLTAGSDGPVPVAFGFHPYLGLPDVPRSEWRIELPAMRRLVLDGRRIPTGMEEAFAAETAPLGSRNFDDGFALDADGMVLAISGGDRRVAVELLEGYRWAQVYAPPDRDLVALEPMTAPSNALASGRGLTVIPAGGHFRASFRIRVES